MVCPAEVFIACRLAGLQQEMEDNARAFAAEINRMKALIAELQQSKNALAAELHALQEEVPS